MDNIITTQAIKDFLSKLEGREVTLDSIRREFNIVQGSKSFDAVRNIMFQLAEARTVKPIGYRSGTYKVILHPKPVRVFRPDRARIPPINLGFPKDFEKGMQFDFAGDIIVRGGDLISIGGVKSTGKTTLSLNFLASNIDLNPILMGNEYTQLVEEEYIPSPRFLSRLDMMSKWVQWTDEQGNDKFTLLPIREDYAEHIVKDKINIIDWINLDANQLYDIGKVLEDIKKNLGLGVAIVFLQKGENAQMARGGQFVRDFSDVEVLLDTFGDSQDDVLLTLKGVKEKTAPIVGKTYAYTIIEDGTKILNFREVIKCPACKSTGYDKAGKCPDCQGKKYKDGTR